MEEWFGLRPTGRQFKEPTGQLVELADDEGLVYLGIAFDPAWHGHPALTRPVTLVRSFLEYPMVVGLVELAHGDPEHGRFVYPTGPVFTLKELMRVHSDLGRTLGPRAALELAYLAGQILTEGAANGGMQGCFSHGGLTPWRLTLRADAHVQVIGYGVPQVDVLAWRTAPDRVPDPDSVRYAPPERLSGMPEDEAADTAALTIIAYEMITGRPLYPGHDAAEVSRSASISEAVPMLSRPNDLPRDIAQVFARSLVFDPDSRLRGEGWLAEMATLLETHGDSDGLEVALGRLKGSEIEGTRRARIQPTNETSSFTARQLATLAKEPTSVPAEPRPARWQKVDRGAARTDAGSPGEDRATFTPSAPARRRRRAEAGDPIVLRVAEEEAEPGDLDLALDLDDLEGDDDLVLDDAVDDVPVRPRLRRRADTQNVPRPPRFATPAPAASATVPPAAGTAVEPVAPGEGAETDAPTSPVTTRRRRRTDLA